MLRVLTFRVPGTPNPYAPPDPCRAAVLIEKDETASTNDDARDLALAGAPSGTAVLAARQTRGRGRAGRSFLSPQGGLYLSVVLRPRLPPHAWALLPLALGNAAVTLLRERGWRADLKWPNDVLIHGRKVAGVLTESRLGHDSFVVAGVGMNLTNAPLDSATSLAAHAAPPDRRELAEALRAAMVRAVERLEVEGAAPTLEEVRRHCVTLGRPVAWDDGEGRARDVSPDGALVVERPDGSLVQVVAGDVRVRDLA